MGAVVAHIGLGLNIVRHVAVERRNLGERFAIGPRRPVEFRHGGLHGQSLVQLFLDPVDARVRRKEQFCEVLAAVENRFDGALISGHDVGKGRARRIGRFDIGIVFLRFVLVGSRCHRA